MDICGQSAHSPAMAIIDPITLTLPDGQDVTLRTLDGADASDFVRFMKDALATSLYLNKYPHEYTLTTWKQRAILRSRMPTPTGLYAGVFHDKKMVGILTSKGDIRLRHEHKVEMGIAIDEAWRGRGLGRAMLEFYIDWCRKTPPILKIELNVNCDNYGAIKLYEELGFKSEGHRHMSIKMADGTFSDDLIMGLILADTKGSAS